jgi:hypothetical protein
MPLIGKPWCYAHAPGNECEGTVYEVLRDADGFVLKDAEGRTQTRPRQCRNPTLDGSGYCPAHKDIADRIAARELPTVGERAAYSDGWDVAEDRIGEGFPAVDVGKGLLTAALITLWKVLPGTELAALLREDADRYASEGEQVAPKLPTPNWGRSPP